MTMISKNSVTYIFIDQNKEGQRLDNFLQFLLKGVPHSHIYRIIRAGEVRVNKGRKTVAYRLMINDIIRIPPIRIAMPQCNKVLNTKIAERVFSIIYEDDALLVINKPAGLAVHGGSGISFGLIELLRKQRPAAPFLELVHRLDRETSGLILIAKQRNALLILHQMMQQNQIDKRYLALVKGHLTVSPQTVKRPLLKYLLPNKERRVKIAEEGQFAHTIFSTKQLFQEYSLLEAQLKTGRTHQIRVHLASLGLPIVVDDKYGDFKLNKKLFSQGLKRMFLHAYSVILMHPLTQQQLVLEAPLPIVLQEFINKLNISNS